MTAVYETAIRGCVKKTAMTAVGGLYLSYILAEETFSDEVGGGRISYSFFVSLCGDDGECDSAYVRDVTSSAEEAERFFTLISEGAVTPCTLFVVAEEFIASR